MRAHTRALSPCEVGVLCVHACLQLQAQRNRRCTDSRLRRQALQSVLNDEDDTTMPPFPHDEADILKLKGFELDYQEQISLASHFTDMDHLGVEYNESEDFVTQSKEALEQAVSE